ncbi:hypothetical protein [Butyrivibrio sp. MC2013]|uniref:hypothetical protein n=1 Tax=Butyrivibrio sp. MC2013 TaxID=1280686 RepID=UPI0004091A06|nr:hypothetical protein [Butyrivibrio sp. MC2013]
MNILTGWKLEDYYKYDDHDFKKTRFDGSFYLCNKEEIRVMPYMLPSLIYKRAALEQDRLWTL